MLAVFGHRIFPANPETDHPTGVADNAPRLNSSSAHIVLYDGNVINANVVFTVPAECFHTTFPSHVCAPSLLYRGIESINDPKRAG
jgi:hypothetical protein